MVPPPRTQPEGQKPAPGIESLTVVGGCVAQLRALAGVEPDDPELSLLVEELLANSSEFAILWEQYEVRPFVQAAKTQHHPEVGRITLDVQSMQIEGTAGHRLVIYHAEPGTPDHDAIVRLDRAVHERAHVGTAR